MSVFNMYLTSKIKYNLNNTNLTTTHQMLL